MTAEARFDIDASSVAKIKVRKHRVSDEFLHDEPYLLLILPFRGVGH
jgi:hypothetical protein